MGFVPPLRQVLSTVAAARLCERDSDQGEEVKVVTLRPPTTSMHKTTFQHPVLNVVTVTAAQATAEPRRASWQGGS